MSFCANQESYYNNSDIREHLSNIFVINNKVKLYLMNFIHLKHNQINIL